MRNCPEFVVLAFSLQAPNPPNPPSHWNTPQTQPHRTLLDEAASTAPGSPLPLGKVRRLIVHCAFTILGARVVALVVIVRLVAPGPAMIRFSRRSEFHQ